MNVHIALTAIGALALTGSAMAGQQPDPPTSIHIGYFNNVGWGQIEYQGSYEPYISVTPAPQNGAMFPTLIEIDLAGLLVDGGYNAFTELKIIDSGQNQYGENSPGADMDYVALMNLDPGLSVTFDYDGPNAVHQTEDSATLKTRVDSIDAESGNTDADHLRHVSLSDQGALVATITGWADGGSDGGVGPIIVPAQRGSAAAPAIRITEGGNGESYDVYVTATTIPAPGVLALLSAAGLFTRRWRRRS